MKNQFEQAHEIIDEEMSQKINLSPIKWDSNFVKSLHSKVQSEMQTWTNLLKKYERK